jgi:hypothetical protein
LILAIEDNCEIIKNLQDALNERKNDGVEILVSKSDGAWWRNKSGSLFIFFSRES